ncbi:MAG TPA: Gfo/Idh/MocA family oxidoreductase [Anaerolineales bacterium]
MVNGERWTRRQFLATSTSAAVAVSAPAASSLPRSSVLGANDTVRLGLIGCGPRGAGDLFRCLKEPKTQAVALCDVDEARIAQAAERIGVTPDIYVDFRRVIDRTDIDAVIVGTPDHWHAIPALHAIRAGKDVYLEKPVGHTIHEGQVLVAAARKHDRVVEVGLQQRSGTIFQEAVRLVQSGKIGKVSRVHCFNAWNAISAPGTGRSQILENLPDGPAPKGVDFDMWLGPAPKRPFNPNRFHWNYIYYWDYSGGMIIAWGVHLIDIVLLAMKSNGPRAVTTAGGRFVIHDARETPDTAEVILEFPEYTLTYSCRHGSSFPQGSPRADHGIQFWGDQATLLVNRFGYQIIPEGEGSEPRVSAKDLDNGDERHQRGFIESIRSRKAPVCSIEEGHRSTTACQLANISYRTGRKITWDPVKELIIGDPEASHYMTKEYRAPWSLV